MLKILARTLIILLAAALVTGGIYWFSGTAAGQSILSSGGGHGGQRINLTLSAQTNPGGQTFQGGPGDGGDRDGGVNLARGLAGIPAKLGVIALITAMIVLNRKLLSHLSRKRGLGAAVSA